MAGLDKLSDIRFLGEINLAGVDTLTLPEASIPGSSLQSAADVTRSQLKQQDNQVYVVPLTRLGVWDALGSRLPGTAADDDLALIAGTFGTNAPTVQSSDAKATSVTQYARFQAILPPEYVEAESVTARLRAGMVTTVSDDTATVDVEAYKQDRDGSVGSDLVTTSASSINSLTKDDKSFTITSSTLSPGDVIDVRLVVAITDSGTATAVIGEISEVALLLDIRG